jgi:tetratricopeptide (TPR) repeat protein
MRSVGTLLKIWFVLAVMSAAAWAADPSPAELLSVGRIDQVVRLLKAGTSSSPSDAQSFHLLSRAYYAVERWDEAIKAGERAVALKPDASEYHLWLGRAYGQKADRSSWFTALRLAGKTRTEFERAVQLDGSNTSARSDLSEYYIEAPSFVGGGVDKAKAQAEALAQKDPASADWVNARLAEKDKNLSEAERLYKAAIEADHGDAMRWVDLASFYRRVRRYDDMEAAINKAVVAPDRRGGAIFESAALLYRTGRNFPKAIELLRKYLASDPHDELSPPFQAHYLLGSILEQQGDKKGATAEYQAVLSDASDYQPAKLALKRLSGG